MRILLVEDDEKSSSYVRAALEARGNVVDEVANGQDALAYAVRERYDVAILDRIIPGLDGLSIVRGLRAAGCKTPVLFLTSLAAIDDRVAGLESGADDYLTKPFSVSELIARVNAIGRRPPLVAPRSELRVADLEVNLVSREVRRDGKSIELLPKEFSILKVLMENEGRIVTRDMLLERVWNIDFDPQSSIVETHMSRLRSKIDRPFHIHLIHNSRNIGYSIHGPK